MNEGAVFPSRLHLPPEGARDRVLNPGVLTEADYHRGPSVLDAPLVVTAIVEQACAALEHRMNQYSTERH
jgi:hypothetical protein